jgi:putative Holliday junction resolvase
LLSGEDGEAAGKARAFAERLRARLRDVDVRLWDERLTTVEAERLLVAGDVRRADRKGRRDAIAASLILQSFLEALAAREPRDG